jgi:AcrR family transcriptional regulator
MEKYMSPRETKESLVIRALLFFGTNDYERSSLDDIASGIGVTKGAIYHHFASKDELFFEASKLLMNMVLEWYSDTIAKIESMERILQDLFNFEAMIEQVSETAGLESVLQNYENVMYMIIASIKKFPELKSIMEKVYQDFRTQLIMKLVRSANEGEIQQNLDIEAIAFEIMAFYEGALLMGALGTKKDHIIFGPRVGSVIWDRIKAK